MNRGKEILRYVVPSVAAMLVTFLYVVIDGIFVGRGVGKDALAAVNIAMPFSQLISAFAAMLAIGGVTIFAIRMGRGEKESALEAFETSAIMVFFMSLILTFVGVVFPDQIAEICGASPLLVPLAAEYIRYYSIFTVSFGATVIMANFVRNDKNPGIAFIGTTIGAVLNVILDWIFVFPLQMGLKGAAIATGISQTVSLLIMCRHFFRADRVLRLRRFSLKRALAGKIFKRGLPELVTQLGQPLTILCYNFVIIRALGEIGVSAYSVICYLTSIATGIFIGVSHGLQPLIGRSFGNNDKPAERYFLRSGFIINLVLSCLFYLVLLLFGRPIISIFNSDQTLISIAHGAIGIYGFSFILASANIILTTYFFSTKRTKQALIVSIFRGLLFNTLFIFGVPAIFGAEAIWYAIILAELAALIAGMICYFPTTHKKVSAS